MTDVDNNVAAQPRTPWRKRIKWDWVFLVLAVAAGIALSVAFPDKGAVARHAWWVNLKEMAFILPAVLVIMGLFMVWVDRSIVIRHLGEDSGLKGILLSAALGTLPTGPLYVGFPMAAALLEKGARVANVLVFLCSWAALSIPAELMELRFMGWKFMLARLVLTVALILPMCIFGEYLYLKGGSENGSNQDG